MPTSTKTPKKVWYQYTDPESGDKYYADDEGNTRWEKPKKGKIVVVDKSDDAAKKPAGTAKRSTKNGTTTTKKNKDGGSGGVFYFGKPNPKQQEFQCNYGDYDSLMKSLPSDMNPFNNWHSTKSKGFPLPDDVTSWFRDDETVAFYGPPSGTLSPLTYSHLHGEIKSFPKYKLPSSSDSSSGVCVVALLLPPTYMAETGAVLMTLIAQKGICVAPIDPGMPLVKIEAALDQLQCTALITTEDLFQTVADKASSMKDIRFIKPLGNYVGAVAWDIVQNGKLVKANFDLSNDTEAPAMLLRTSGTTSTPKIVPLTRTGLLYNAVCLASSLSLDPKGGDVGCNGMPLFHIGGIAANLMAVLVSGTSVVMLQDSFDGQAFFEALTTKSGNSGKYKQPNWYSGVPSMHKAILLAAKTNPTRTKTNRMRFIRSGAAHLPHGTAVEMAQVFGTVVYPTYSMSECMPICSSNDAPVTASAKDRKGVPDDTVGVPTGGSMAIVDAGGSILLYGEIGQVAIRGPGVIDAYIGIPLSKSHTAEGWFLTGDMGQLDRNGRLVLSGRQKEMIKRGGDQVWPNEVDGAVESVPGVRLAVTFGVPNELWGEEVQVAVVLDNEVKSSVNKEELEQEIREACTTQLGAASAPSKVLYVETHQLLKGNTGKFLRMKMAEHLGAKAVDTKALHALEQMAALAGGDPADAEAAKVPAATPSTALNGMRFIVACFVVWLHIGYAPTDRVAKMQTFSFNMIIFFILGGFQLVTSLKSEVLSSSAQFIGTKIGSMHAWYLVSQIIALPALIIGSCSYAKEVYQAIGQENCMDGQGEFWWYYISYTITGMGLPFPFIGYNNIVNGVTWFQQVFYQFLILFPILDYRLRYSSRTKKLVVFWVTLIVGVGGVALLHYYYSYGEPDGVVQGLIYLSIISWLPTLVLSMLFGYWFSEYACLDDPLPDQKTNLWQRPKQWGYITDFLSFVFLVCMIYVAFSPNCLWTTVEVFGYMRPGQSSEDLQTMMVVQDQTITTMVKVCDMTYEEYEVFIYPFVGSWRTEFATFMGSFGLRLGTPLVLVWIFGLAYGRGITARIFNNFILQWLSTFAYPVYLLQLPVVRFYWMATRGLPPPSWWIGAGGFQVPVNLWEVPIIILICVVLAWPIERFVVQPLTPYTISWGVWICKLLSRCLCCGKSGEAVEVGDTTQAQVEHMVKGLTGNPDVTASTKLTDLGLDSLGATALLGALKSTVPNAKSLTMSQLSSCDTVGDLVEMLDGTTETAGEGSESASPV